MSVDGPYKILIYLSINSYRSQLKMSESIKQFVNDWILNITKSLLIIIHNCRWNYREVGFKEKLVMSQCQNELLTLPAQRDFYILRKGEKLVAWLSSFPRGSGDKYSLNTLK